MNRPSKMKPTFERIRVQKIYSSARWTRFSKQCLRESPSCVPCKEKGITQAAQESHHKIKLAARPDLAFVKENIMSVCKECHLKLD